MSSSDASAATADARGGAEPPARARAVAIVGPTASGKTALSIEVARRIRGEIVSMDSRQVYRGMDIGTAKATPTERAAVPHHGLDLVEPGERFSAGRFAEYARACIDDIRARGSAPVLVGGTGFFLRALTHPLFDEPRLDPDRRQALETFFGSLDEATLRCWLDALDPETATSLRRGGGRQRVLRALEIALLTGRPLDWWHAHAAPPAEPLLLSVFVLELDRALLDRRIDQRVHAMMDAGLVEEVQGLLRAGVAPDAPGMTATGYREVVAYLRGDVSFENAVSRIQLATRQYARRQLTWFRNQVGPEAVRLDAARPVDELAATIVDVIAGEKA